MMGKAIDGDKEVVQTITLNVSTAAPGVDGREERSAGCAGILRCHAAHVWLLECFTFEAKAQASRAGSCDRLRALCSIMARFEVA